MVSFNLFELMVGNKPALYLGARAYHFGYLYVIQAIRFGGSHFQAVFP